MYVDDILVHVDKQEAENLGKKLVERFDTVQFKESGQSPGAKSRFMVVEDSEKLSEEEHMIFRSRVAKLLFFSQESQARYTHSSEISVYTSTRGY